MKRGLPLIFLLLSCTGPTGPTGEPGSNTITYTGTATGTRYVVVIPEITRPFPLLQVWISSSNDYFGEWEIIPLHDEYFDGNVSRYAFIEPGAIVLVNCNNREYEVIVTK